MDATTRQVTAFHVGYRSHTSAAYLWAQSPQAYRQHATLSTDSYVVYAYNWLQVLLITPSC